MSEPAPVEFVGTPRYEVVARIGSGGMGVVYHARDRRRNDEVALKTLLRVDPSGILHLKQEFRALADIVHPNLVTLHDLEVHDGQWFFTMELVRGRTLFEYLKSASSPAAVEPALRQAAIGLAALHELGKLHRDIKPSNVMVNHRGRVVILDFGLVTELRALKASPKIRGHAVGTPWYMAPEQARSAAMPTAAADWYSFGVLCYEALTGRLPFDGSMAQVLFKKQEEDPPAPSEVVPGVPPHLDALCMALLSRDPDLRPKADEVLARLGEVRRPARRRAVIEVGDLIGRREELARLSAAFERAKQGAVRVTRLRGPSGMGKSALLRAFLDHAAIDPTALALYARCYQRESVPFKALDGLIDRLTEVWRSLPAQKAESYVPEDIALLARTFPVLRRVPVVERAMSVAPEIRDPLERRRRTFVALREVVERFARDRPLIVAIDDVQWGDADSAAMLGALLEVSGSAALLILLVFREEDVDTSPVLRVLLETFDRAEVEDVRLEPLRPSEARELALRLLQGPHEVSEDAPFSGDSDPELLASRIAEESGGGPWLLEELARGVASRSEEIFPIGREVASVESLVNYRMARLPAGARRLLEAVALAGRPVPENVALEAAEAASFAREALAVLGAEHWIATRSADGTALLETYHDRVRETVVEQLPDGAKKSLHLRLGLGLEAIPEADPQTLLEHFLGAGDRPRSRRYAEVAATRAEHALAFEQASHLYRVALDLEGEAKARVSLAARLGEALANAGRGREAADHLLRAGRDLARLTPNDDRAVQLEQRAVEEYLRSGHIDEGVAALVPLARKLDVAVPKGKAATLVSLLASRARIRARGLAREPLRLGPIAHRDLLRLELCRSAYVGFSLVDPLLSLHFQARYLLLALETGERKSLAISLTGEAIYHATLGGARGRARCQELLAWAERLAAESGDQYALATHKFQAASAAFMEGRLRESHRLHAEAVEILRSRCTGAFWEVVSGEAFTFTALAYLGELGELQRRLPDARRRADERGDRFAAATFRIGPMTLGELAEDRVRAVRDGAFEALQGWPSQSFSLQHWLQILALVQADLYEGAGARAFARIEAAWPKIKGAQLLRILAVAMEIRYIRALAAVSAAVEVAAGRASELGSKWSENALVRVALDEAAKMARLDHLFAAPSAAVIRAGVARLRREDATARVELLAAAEGFLVAGMSLHAAAAHRALGRLEGGDGGRARVLEADATFSRQGVSKPERLAQALIPL